MKLLKIHAENFGSYESLELDFQEMGLALLQGPTGAGKSTVMDMVFWAMFGQTAKGGNVDEVRSWKAIDSITKVILTIEVPNAKLSITRIRGKSSQNDLYWV